MMKESEFYKMCDIVEGFGDVTGGYYPTVDELKAHNIEDNVDLYMPFLAYYASNPLKKADSPDAEDREYIEAVAYCKEVLTRAELAKDA